MKKILVCNDLPVTSKAALAINSHIFSLFSYQVDMLVTKLYSTHLGFKEVISLDTSSFFSKTLELYQKMNLDYDFIYAGLLLNETNISALDRFLTPGKKFYLDPIMGDNGHFYKTIDTNYPKLLRPLVKKAYLITPNLFEACAILGEDMPLNYNESALKEILVKLTDLGPSIAIITGVKVGALYGAITYEKDKNEFYFSGKSIVNYYPHGVGDIFSTLLVSFLDKTNNLKQSLDLTIEAIYQILDYNNKQQTDLMFGLCYENILAKFLKQFI